MVNGVNIHVIFIRIPISNLFIIYNAYKKRDRNCCPVSNLSHTQHNGLNQQKNERHLYRIEYRVILDKIVWFSIIHNFFSSIFSCKHTISHTWKMYWRTIRIGIVTTLESLQWLYYMIGQPTDRPTTFTISIEQCTIHSN